MDGLVPYFCESATELSQLEFGEESNSDSIPDDENVYDAVNDETFGAEVSSFSINDDGLEEFAKTTANLALLDEPGCSVPDPSQIPIPNLRNDFYKKDMNKNDEIIPSSIWATGSFNGIGSFTEAYAGQLKTEYQNASMDEQTQQLQRLLDTGLSAISHSSLIVDDTTPTKVQNQPLMVQRQEINNLPKMPTATAAANTGKTGSLSLEVLERQMLMEAAAAQQKLIQNQENAFVGHQSYSSSEPPLPTQNVNSASQLAQLPPHQLVQQMTQHYQAIMAAAISKGLPIPPLPPIPLIPPFLGGIMPTNNSQIPPATAICPGSIPADPALANITASIPPTPIPNYSNSAAQMALPHLPEQKALDTLALMPQLSMIPSSLHPREEGRRRQRQTGLPSGRTISDFALDPYAGFMSTKEREWLIKIQIIQCLGSGDPLEDDFYYTVWKEKNILQKAPEQWKSKENPKYYKFEATFPSTGYIAPSFLGSLGRPIHSSASQPRQIIEVRGDNQEEDLSLSKNRQKRLKAALMKIENGALALLDCQNIRRKLRFFEETCITAYLDQHEITDRTARFADNVSHVDAILFTLEALPTMMLIHKGRRIIYQWLKFWNEEVNRKETPRVGRMLASLPKFAKKIPEEEFKEFADVVCNCFANFPLDKLFEFLNCTANWELSFISDSKLAQLVLLSLICAAVDISEWNLRLNQLHGTGAAKFLNSHPTILKVQPSSDVDSELFKQSQWAQLRQWLIREHTRGNVCGQGTLVQWIVQNQTLVLI